MACFLSQASVAVWVVLALVWLLFSTLKVVAYLRLLCLKSPALQQKYTHLQPGIIIHLSSFIFSSLPKSQGKNKKLKNNFINGQNAKLTALKQYLETSQLLHVHFLPQIFFLPAAKIIFDLLPNKFLPLLYQLPVFLVLNSCVCRPRKFHFHTLP